MRRSGSLSGPVVQKTLVTPQDQFRQGGGHACCPTPNGFLWSAVHYSGTVYTDDKALSLLLGFFVLAVLPFRPVYREPSGRVIIIFS